MGKRELLIALAFIVAGTVAFQFSAPPAKETSSSRFSFSKIIDNMRRGMHGNQSFIAPPRTTNYEIGPDITMLRLQGSSTAITIQGEARNDVSLQLTVTSTGENAVTAVAIAGKTQVLEDRVGGMLTLHIQFPTEETQTAQLVLKVPQRLGVRLDGSRETTITNIRAVELATAARGTTQIDHIAERVSGEQNGGTINLASIGAVKMTLTRARGRINDVVDLNLDVRDGDTSIVGSKGALVVEERRADLTIRDHKGAVKVSGTDGRVRIEGATGEITLDLQRAEVDAEVASSAGGSIVTTNEELRVSLIDTASVHIDAVASNGTIDGADWTLTPAKTGNDSRVDAVVGAKSASAPRLSLRNQNGNIVLKKSRKK